MRKDFRGKGVNGGLKGNKIYQAWSEANGEDRFNFVFALCIRYRGIVRRVMEKIDNKLKEKKNGK